MARIEHVAGEVARFDDGTEIQPCVRCWTKLGYVSSLPIAVAEQPGPVAVLKTWWQVGTAVAVGDGPSAVAKPGFYPPCRTEGAVVMDEHDRIVTRPDSEPPLTIRALPEDLLRKIRVLPDDTRTGRIRVTHPDDGTFWIKEVAFPAGQSVTLWEIYAEFEASNHLPKKTNRREL
jgi:hypothetical protein